jgi:hypothetical protein
LRNPVGNQVVPLTPIVRSATEATPLQNKINPFFQKLVPYKT